MLRPGDKIDGKYRLIRELGAGGMGAVWLVRHELLGTQFAAKFLSRNGPSSAIHARFIREARLAAQLRGPHVPQVFDLGEFRGVPYILMEFLEGEDLRRRLDRGVLSETEMLQIVVPVARVLSRAHALGIVHRDLKPENLFLARFDGEELVKVLDFGVAKVLPSGALASVVTRTDAVLGTPYYMSPEQLRNSKEIDHRADLWALALLVFEMLVGRRAFQCDSISQLVLQLETQELPDPLALRPALPPTFRAWWLRAAARRPEDRFPDVLSMVHELARALDLPEPDLSAVAPDIDALARTEMGETSDGDEPLPPLEEPEIQARTQNSVLSLDASGAPPSPAPGGSLLRSGVVVLAASALALGIFWLGQRSGSTATLAQGAPASSPSVSLAMLPPTLAPSTSASPASASSAASVLPLPLPESPASGASVVASAAASPRARPAPVRPASSPDTIGF